LDSSGLGLTASADPASGPVSPDHQTCGSLGVRDTRCCYYAIDTRGTRDVWSLARSIPG